VDFISGSLFVTFVTGGFAALEIGGVVGDAHAAKHPTAKTRETRLLVAITRQRSSNVRAKRWPSVVGYLDDEHVGIAAGVGRLAAGS
jgi:hypothetical protein